MFISRQPSGTTREQTPGYITIIPAGDDGKEALVKRYSTFWPLLIVTESHMGLRVIGITGHVPFLSGSYARGYPFCGRALVGIVHMLIRINGFPITHNLCIHDRVEL